MPKLGALQTAERLRKQLVKLLGNEEVAIRDLRALLTTQQKAAMDAAWKQQQALRKQKRARTEDEQRELGWKTKREVQIEIVTLALSEYEASELSELKDRQKARYVRQSNIFLREFFSARKAGKDHFGAWNWANNELVRAGLRRLDVKVTRDYGKRDKEVREMEEQILTRLRNEMTVEEREQDELLRELEKTERLGRSK